MLLNSSWAHCCCCRCCPQPASPPPPLRFLTWPALCAVSTTKVVQEGRACEIESSGHRINAGKVKKGSSGMEGREGMDGEKRGNGQDCGTIIRFEDGMCLLVGSMAVLRYCLRLSIVMRDEHMYVCVYVCMYVCVHVCMCACMCRIYQPRCHA